MQNNARLCGPSNTEVNFSTIKLPIGPTSLLKIMVGLTGLTQINSYFTSPAETKLATLATLAALCSLIVIHTQP